MKITRYQVDAILQVLSDLFGVEIEDGTFRSDYSGRGMRGQSCVGFVLKPGHQAKLGAAIALALENDGVIDLVIEMLERVATDDMAWDVIVYFPHVQLIEEK